MCSHFAINSKVLVYLIFLFGVCGVVLGVLLFVRNMALQPLSPLLISPLRLVWGRGEIGERKGNSLVAKESCLPVPSLRQTPEGHCKKVTSLRQFPYLY